MRILVVDNNNELTLGPRLPRVLAALGRFRLFSAGFYAARGPDGRIHDLAQYDLALLHDGDTKTDDHALAGAIGKGMTACVVFTGNTFRPSAANDRLLILSDAHVLAHAEDGVAFWECTGRLDLTAWTNGFTAARRADIHRLCEPLRKLLRGLTPTISPKEVHVLKEVPRKLATWSGAMEFDTALAQLAAFLNSLPPEETGDVAKWLMQRRDALKEIEQRLITSV